MNEARARAPGKLLVVGEYAVLHGAPALVAAVDRCARVRLRRGGGDAGRITCTPLGVSREPYTVRDGRLHCRESVTQRLGLTAGLVPRLVSELGGPAESADGLAIEIDSGDLFERAASGQRVKLGLGSSAAVTAALITAMEALFDDERESIAPPLQRLRRWLPVYRDLLGGRASGADLAASLAGGLVEFRDPGDSPLLAARSWPESLHWLPVWVGAPTVSTDFVAAFDRWRGERRSTAERLIAELSELAASACAALERPATFLDALQAYGRALEGLGREAGIEIVSAPHRALTDSARRAGVVYKSCGAGGGDLGIAVSDDPERLGAFGRRVSREGAVPLNLAMAETGAARSPVTSRS